MLTSFEFTEVVVPLTVKLPLTIAFPAIVTVSVESPICTALEANPPANLVFKFAIDTSSTVVSPASAVDELVPNCKVVTEPPNEIAEPSTVIEEFAKLAFAIEVPFHTPAVIVPNVVIEVAPVNPVLSASCNTT